MAVMDEDDFLLLDRQVCFPLYAASNLIVRAYRPVLAEVGLTYPQYLVMLVLWENEPQSVGSLGERLHLDSGTLTPLLKRIEASGLVTRERDPRDERRVIVALTDAGRTLRDRVRHVPMTLSKALGLSDEEATTLRGMTAKLIGVLGQAEGPRQADEADRPSGTSALPIGVSSCF